MTQIQADPRAQDGAGVEYDRTTAQQYTGMPADHDAEADVIGAVVNPRAVIDPARLNITGDDFDRPELGAVFDTVTAMRIGGETVNPISVADRARSFGVNLDPFGGANYLTSMMADAAFTPQDVKASADIIARKAADRRTLDLTAAIAQRIREGADPSREIARLSEERRSGRLAITDRLLPAGDAILDAADRPAALWGRGSELIWASGESLHINATQGTGKTTTAEQLALGRAGFTEYGELFDLPVKPAEKRVLYVAADRPPQMLRSFARMVTPAMRSRLNERMSIWRGPLPPDMLADPYGLVRLAAMAKADTLFLDSLKDIIGKLQDDEAVGAFNTQRQNALVEGVEICELHHPRKNAEGDPQIEDVFGSTMITNGDGSVLQFKGKPGDPVVKVFHTKQPAGEVGPLTVIHDSLTGRTTVQHGVDLVQAARGRDGLTAKDAAQLLFGKDDRNSVEKARRKLAALCVKSGSQPAQLVEEKVPGVLGGKPTSVWRAITGAITRP